MKWNRVYQVLFIMLVLTTNIQETSSMLGRSKIIWVEFGEYDFPIEESYEVLNKKDVVTQIAGIYETMGSIGLAAHRHLAGKYFNKIWLGMPIEITYENGTVETYYATSIQRFRQQGKFFVDLSTGKSYTDYEFISVFTDLTLVTCISTKDDPSWGRWVLKARRLK